LQHVQTTGGLQHAIELRHRLLVFDHVLQDVVAEDNVELLIVERCSRDIRFRHVRRAGMKIRPDVTQRCSPEPLFDRFLGSEMENRLGPTEKVGLVTKVEPQKPVPAQRQTAGTELVPAVPVDESPE